jgi:hypothetical protein
MPQDGNAGLKKMFARIRRGLRLVVGGILMLIVISVVINFFDEDLASETQGMLARSPNPYSPHENIYIALAGANAPSGQSVTEAGLARIKRYDDQSDLPISEQAARDLASLDMPASGLSFHGQFAHCPTDKPVPWAEAPKWRAEIEAAFNANQELYERYLALYRLVGYFETARISDAMPISRRNCARDPNGNARGAGSRFCGLGR